MWPGFSGEWGVIDHVLSYTDIDFVIMAAGSGTRMQAKMKKQWIPIENQPLFVYTLSRLLVFGADSLIVVVHPDDVEATARILQASGVPKSCCRIVTGGSDRQESVFHGIRVAKRKFVAVHDAARPFIDKDDIAAVVKRARITGAATLGYPVRDTLVRTDDEAITEAVPRDSLWQVQTPQVFLHEWLLAAHVQAMREGFHGTDDTALVARLGHRVDVVRGSALNVKITEPGDAMYLRLWEGRKCE